MSILPLFLVMCAYILSKAFENKIILGIVSCLLCLFFTYKTVFKYWDEGDTSLGFIDTVKLHKEMVDYCEKQQLYDKTIYTNFLLLNDLRYPSLGYLNDKTRTFSKLNSSRECNNDILIFYSCEPDSYRDNIDYDVYTPLKQFKKGIAWGEIYQRK